MKTLFSNCGREGLPKSLTVGTMNRRAIYPTSNLQNSIIVSVLVCLMILLSGITTVFAGAGELKWRYKTGDLISNSSPAIGSDGTVYIGSADWSLYAINSNGTLKWSYKTDKGFESSPAIGIDGTVYIGSGDDYLYAINSDGTLKWKYKTGNYIYSSPAIGTDGTVALTLVH